MTWTVDTVAGVTADQRERGKKVPYLVLNSTDVVRRHPYRGYMKRVFCAFAFTGLFLAPVGAAPAQVSFGIHIGEPPAPRAYRVPPRPAPDYVWIEGYHYPQGKSYKWHDGYWTRPPYQGAYWVEPYYVGGQYFPGQWEGSRAPIAHDHRSDKDKRRDERPDPGSNGRRR